MPLNPKIHKVMVIGSGPIIIGQAAEFDYAGNQACKALKEKGLEVVLVNSNPATLMTDHAMADEIYIEPLTLETVMRIIEKEKPDIVLADVFMPNIDILGVLDELKKFDEKSRPLVMALSSYANPRLEKDF